MTDGLRAGGLRNKARAKILAAALVIGTMGVTAFPAQAQFPDGYTFLKSVRDRNKPDAGQKALDLIRKPGSTIVNARDVSNGDTALHIVTRERDLVWLRFLLKEGANPNIVNNAGDTPLMAAVVVRSADAAAILLGAGAQVDKDNSRGETALIRAVQLGDVGMVRLLIGQGANPDKRDSMAGMSARDYATRDSRLPGMEEALNAKTAATTGPKREVQGPTF